MGLIKKIKELEERMDINLNRFNYKFSKVVFNVMILLMISLTLMVWAEYDFANIKTLHLYYECELPNYICDNELYDLCNVNSIEVIEPSEVCSKITPKMYEKEFLMMGESIGHKPSWLANNISTLYFILIGSAFLFNHVVINKKSLLGGKK